jgi:hypothetical protein
MIATPPIAILKVQPESGALIMNHPAWKEMTTEQKCAFLHEWCDNLTRKAQTQESTIQRLHERLQAVEAKTSMGSA